MLVVVCIAEIDTKVEIMLPDSSGIVTGIYDGFKSLSDDVRNTLVNSTTEAFMTGTMFIMFSVGALYLFRKVGAKHGSGNN